MVVAGPSTQPNELEQRKKRQTLERAKANHLSKQLQMRLQYAKLKVEHGWQRQNLNEVENLYFHHSHQRHMRHGTIQRAHHATVATYPHSTPVPAETHPVQSPALPAVPDRTVGPSPLANDVSSPSSSVSPASESPSEHAPSADVWLVSEPQPFPPVQTPVLMAPASIVADHPPSALDLSDPNVLARLVQLPAQVPLPSQPKSRTPHPQTVSRHLSTTVPSTPASASPSQPTQVPMPLPIPISGTGVFPLHVQFSQVPQPGLAVLSTPIPGSAPLYISGSAPNNTALPSQSPVLAPASSLASAPTIPIPTTAMPPPTPIAPSALTYDSFWSTHASSTGPTRALYRTHTGFTASATPGGNVAMLTPGGHAAVMTAEGVYVGGANK